MFTLLLLTMVTNIVVPRSMPQSQAAKNKGLISGEVKDELGNPVPGITVLAQSMADANEVVSSETDLAGRFRLSINYGKYSIIATNDKYADCRQDIFGCALERIDVKEDSSVHPIELRIRKAGRIHVTLTDKASNAPIKSAFVTVRRGDDYTKAVVGMVGSTFSWKVPADVDLTISILTDHYRIWTYRAPETAYATFRVSQGVDVDFDVKMVRVDP